MVTRFGLRIRFLMPVICLIILGMGASSFVSYVKSRDALKSSIESQVHQIAQSTIEVIESWLKERRLDLSNWSRQNVFSTALKDSFVGQAARASASQQLEELQKDYLYYEILVLANKAGDVVAASQESVVGKTNVKDTPYFQDALNGNTAFSQVITSRTSGNPVFCIAAPVKEKKDIVGVLFGVVDVSAFSSQFVDSVHLGKSGYAYLYQEDGFVIAHPNKKNILKLNMKEFDFGRKMMAQGSGAITYTFQGVEKLVAFQKEKHMGWTVGVGASTADILNPVTRLAYTNVGIAALVVLVAVLLVLMVVNSLVKPLYRLSRGLGEAALQVFSASGEVSSSSQSLAEGASEQAASIEETSSSLEEIASMTKQNAANASLANTLADETKSTTQSCSGIMQEMAAAIGQVSESAQETQKIVKIIDEIAFQTNLLALNAAVEAARAGEAGAGFAVVADEVRNLAMRAAEAARNTTERIEDINKKVRGAMDMAFKTVDEFSKVDENTKKVGELVAEIAGASREQSQGIEQLNTAVAEMDKVVQRNAASAEETASAFEEMSAQAEDMQGFVRELNVTIGGRKAAVITETPVAEKRDRKIRPPQERVQARALKPGGHKELSPVGGRSLRQVNPGHVIPLNEDDLKHF